MLTPCWIDSFKDKREDMALIVVGGKIYIMPHLVLTDFKICLLFQVLILTKIIDHVHIR